MEISFKKALYAPFNDKNWIKKVGIGVLFFIPALIASSVFGQKHILTGLLSFIAGFFLAGYSWMVLHNEINNISDILPDWDIVKVAYLGVQGGLISLAYLLISLPVVAVFVALFFYLKALAVILGIIAAVIVFLFYLVLLPIAQSLFAKDFEFSQAFDFQNLFNIAKNSWNYYLLALLYSLLIGIIFGVSFGIVGGIVGFISKFLGESIIQISQIVMAISSANLYGQTFKKAIENI